MGDRIKMKFGLTEETYQKIKEVINNYQEYTFKVFGSRARGDFKYNSDIDIAVEGEIGREKQIEIMNSFDMLDIPYMVDIVFVCELQKEELIESIKKDGVIYE